MSIDISRLRTRDGRKVEWAVTGPCIDLEVCHTDRLGSDWLARCYDDGIHAGANVGTIETGGWAKSCMADSIEDAQRQAVAYLLSTGELVQAGSAGPTREELLERALRDALYHGDFSEAPDAYTYIEAVLGGENPWADEEAP